jgi:ankyrin repeat protein
LLHLAAKFNNNRKVNDGANSGTNNQELDNVSHEISTSYGKDTWNQANAEGHMPVHVAAYYGNNAFIQYVIEKVHNGKDHVLESTQNTRKMNVLHICAEQSVPSSLENKKDDNKKDENKKDDNKKDENKKDKIKYVL